MKLDRWKFDLCPVTTLKSYDTRIIFHLACVYEKFILLWNNFFEPKSFVRKWGILCGLVLVQFYD